MTITHTMVSAKVDGADATVVRPSDWNANHTITPDTIVNVLSDHNKAVHDALNIDADTLDGIDSLAFVKADGTVPLTGNWDAGAFEIRAETLESDVATGMAPLTIASTTVVANLNADQLDGNHAAAFAVAAKGVTNGDTHDHSGGDGNQIDHTTLSNIGANTHAQVDTHITTTNPHSSTALATPDRLVLRDAAGRAAVVAPAAATDIALKSTITADIATHAGLTASHGVSSKIAGIAIGNYTGNGAQNRAIAHGLGVIPKWVRIIKIDGSWNYDIPKSAVLYYMNDSNAGVIAVTAWDAVNFYVGDAGNTDNGANKTGGHDYYWIAFT